MIFGTYKKEDPVIYIEKPGGEKINCIKEISFTPCRAGTPLFTLGDSHTWLYAKTPLGAAGQMLIGKDVHVEDKFDVVIWYSHPDYIVVKNCELLSCGEDEVPVDLKDGEDYTFIAEYFCITDWPTQAYKNGSLS